MRTASSPLLAGADRQCGRRVRDLRRSILLSRRPGRLLSSIRWAVRRRGKWPCSLAILIAASAGGSGLAPPLSLLFVGWFWYLGMLVPVLGLFNAGWHTATADRYTYLPQIGLSLPLAWAVARLAAGSRGGAGP